MDNDKNTAPQTVPVEDLGLIFGAAEDSTLLLQTLTEEFFLDCAGDPKRMAWEFNRARALATSIEFQVGYIFRELKKLGASR